MRLRSFLAEVIKTPEAVYVLRGVTKIRFSDSRWYEPIYKLIQLLHTHPSTEHELLAHFDQNLHNDLRKILSILIQNNIIIPFKETQPNILSSKEIPEDIFYWHFKKNSRDVKKQLALKKLAIIGKNDFSISLLRLFKISGLVNCILISDYILDGPMNIANNETHESSTNFITDSKNDLNYIIAIAPFNQRESLSKWNKHCLKNGISFFPVLVNNLRAYLGPHVSLNSPCFDCAIQRFASNIEPYYPLNIDQQIGNLFNLTHIHGYHVCMVEAVASFVCMEIINYFLQLTPTIYNKIIDLCLITNEATSSKIIRSPGCTTCEKK